MTRKEITDHYNKKVSLVTDISALEKLHTYLDESKRHMRTDSQGIIFIEGIEKEIVDLESSIQKKTDELAMSEGTVRATLKLIPDRVSRMAASLHYCSGLSWAEVGAILHTSDETIRTRVSRAIRGAGIL